MTTYQVALSYAGEQRDYVERVARALQARGIAIFYDRFESVTLWGKDGTEFFHQIFAADSSAVVMFISKEYVSKKWTRHERRAALSKAIEEESEYVLPVRFDDTPVPGLPNTIQYQRASDYSPETLAALISEKIGVPPLSAKASDAPPPRATSNTGEASFDFTSFNSQFIIGSGPLEFVTLWSESDGSSMVLYNDPSSIHGIAVASDVSEISHVEDASRYDFTHRARRPKVGQIAILRNTRGFYAALKILEVHNMERGSDRNELKFEYVIQSNGTASFAEIVSE